MRAAAGAHHVRADASRKAQHQVGACRGAPQARRSMRIASASSARPSRGPPPTRRTSQPPVAAADLVGEDRDLMARARADNRP